MLEAIRERAQGWIAKVILALLIVPFALWGIDSYFSNGGKESPAATVDDVEITQKEFLKAVRDQKEALGGKVEEQALRGSVMDQLVNTRLLLNAAIDSGFSIHDPQIQAMLAGAEVFQDQGKFSQERFDAWLKSRGMTEGELMGLLRQDQLLTQIQLALGEGAVVARPSVLTLANLLGQKREVNEVVFDKKNYLKQVQVDDQAVQAEYNARKNDYATPRQARVQYLVLSLSAIEQSTPITDETIKKHYEGNLGKYQEPERRRASHILIQAADSASKEKAKAQAEQILAELRKQPASFAALARQHSQDPGSAQKGGDLGAFARDMMVKPFADAVWSMKQGEIRGLVESSFGYHIIRLDGVIPGAKMAFDAVKEEIRQNLRREEAQRRFAEVAERFSNLVYEKPDSLEPAAKEFGLKIETSGWIDEKQAIPAFLAHPRVQQALFADDSLNKHHNIEAVEVSPNVLVSARVVEYRPAGVRPLAQVSEEIRQKLALTQAHQQAVVMGKQALAAAQSGKEIQGWSATMALSRMQPLNVPRDAIKSVFRSDAAKLPVLVGVETAEGYRLYRITRVVSADTAPQLEMMRADLMRMQAQEEMRAYLEHRKAKAKIKITLPEAGAQ